MKSSTAATTFLLGLLAGTVVVTDAGWDQIKIKDNGITFKVRRYDDGRTTPYRLIFRDGEKSLYKIRYDGRVTHFKGGSEKYKVKYRGNGDIREVIRKDNGVRMLLADDLNEDFVETEDLLDESISAEGISPTEHRRLTYACDDCEEAWDVVCGPALSYICELVGNEILGTVGSQSVDTACDQFGSLCGSLSAEEACDGECVEGQTFIRVLDTQCISVVVHVGSVSTGY